MCLCVCTSMNVLVSVRVCVYVWFLQDKAQVNVCLSVMNLLNLGNTGVLELQGLPYAAQDRAGGNKCVCVFVGVCVCVCVALWVILSGCTLRPA